MCSVVEQLPMKEFDSADLEIYFTLFACLKS